jgi:hypothetical protein
MLIRLCQLTVAVLLRLDFNGVFTTWLDEEAEGVASKHILAEGGL